MSAIGASAGSAPAERPTRRVRRDRGAPLYWFAGIVSALIFIIPLVWAVLRSLQPADLVSAAPTGRDFSHLTTSNYSQVFGARIALWTDVRNSLIASVGAALLATVITTLAGYGFARFRFRGAGIAFGAILVTLMIPFQAILTPLFLELNSVGLTNSLLGLVLFYTTLNLPFGVFVMRNTFASLPSELEDSARVDGTSTLQTLLLVLRPLILPGAATVFLYAFLQSWTDFLGALTFLTKSSLFTLPVGLFNLESGNYGQLNYGDLMAGAVVSMIPCVVLFIALQRYYVRGLTQGALKG